MSRIPCWLSVGCEGIRLFQTAATGTEYNSNTTYHVGWSSGRENRKLGIQGGELVTIPFFAEPRQPAIVNLNQQSDDTNKSETA